MRRLTVADESAFLEGLSNWSKGDRRWLTFSWRLGMSFVEHLEQLKKEERGIDLKPDYVAGSILYGFVGGRIVGLARPRDVVLNPA